MRLEDSTIRSATVSLGTNRQATAVTNPEPWNMLICGDFGFNSLKPEKISAAMWNEFLETHAIKIHGSVENNLPDQVTPFYLEYGITTLKDFSLERMKSRIPALAPYAKALEILDDVSLQKMSASNGADAIAALNLPIDLLSTARSTKQPSTENQKVDSILSMLDIAPANQTPAQNDIVAALSADSVTEVSSSYISGQKQLVHTLLQSIVDGIFGQEFFSSKMASWHSLRRLLKVLGRNRDFCVYLYSKADHEAVQSLQQGIIQCAEETAVPDIILWDYPVKTTTASMNDLENVAQTAERYKSIVLSSLEGRDPLLEEICHAERLEPILQQPAYIPFKRLRKAAVSRSLMLCIPSVKVVAGEDDRILEIGSGWVVAEQWINGLIQRNSPFDIIPYPSTDQVSFCDISEHIASEAANFGLSVIKTLQQNIVSSPRVLLETEDQEQMGSFGFNFAVNRTARLAAEWLFKNTKELESGQLSDALQRFLISQLGPYHILSSDDALSISTEDNCIQVAVDSKTIISGHPVRFQFSLGHA